MIKQTGKLYFHIGYHKTSTTKLQKDIFPNLPGINYIGRNYTTDTSLTSSIPFLSRHFKSLKKEYWVEGIAYKAKFSPKKYSTKIKSKYDQNHINLISHENILRPFSIQRTLERISSLSSFFKAKICLILTIRQQVDLLRSRYLHDKKIGRTKVSIHQTLCERELNLTSCSFPFCNQIGNKCSCPKSSKLIHLPFYNYNDLLSSALLYFDMEDIIIWPYESICTQPYNCFSELYDQSSLSNFSLIDFQSKQLASNATYQIDSETENMIFNYYAKGNSELDLKIPKLELKKLNYY